MSSTTTQPLMSIPETAQLLGIATRTLYSLVSRDEIPHVRVGGQIRFVPAQLEQWLADQAPAKPAA